MENRVKKSETDRDRTVTGPWPGTFQKSTFFGAAILEGIFQPDIPKILTRVWFSAMDDGMEGSKDSGVTMFFLLVHYIQVIYKHEYG